MRLEFIEVTLVIEIDVYDRAVVFSSSDEHGGLAAKQEIMRVFRMQPQC
jgi:hypothetical protein